jgi:peptide/nickel transport system permease protein
MSAVLTPTSEGRNRAVAEAKAQRRERLRLLARKPGFLIGMLISLFWVACALFGTSIAPQDPFVQDPINKLKEPTAAHWFGTDNLGRDVFSRVIIGARLIVFVALGATLIAAFFGTILGLVAGYYKGRVDEVLMRTLDVFMSIPTIVLALLITTSIDSKSMFVVMGIIALVFTPVIARNVRASALGETELDYVAAAQLRTEKTPHILFKEVLPNILPTMLVEFTAIATLSFLGTGVSPESPDWGTQVATHRGFLNGRNVSSTLFPALAIATISIGVNLIQDALNEAFER